MTIQEKIEWLRRYILVHSYIYYELNENVISDKKYDEQSRELVRLQKDNPDVTGMYYDQFKDFDGTTGFDLYHRLSEDQQQRIQQIAMSVIHSYKASIKPIRRD